MRHYASIKTNKADRYWLLLLPGLLMFFSGCSGTGTPNVPAYMDERTKILQIIEGTPYQDELSGDITTQILAKNKNALPAGVTSVVRNSIQVSRKTSSITFNETTASVEAVFLISGTLLFKNSQGNTVSEKSINVQTPGSYKLSKDANGTWQLKENAVDGLIFRTGDVVVGGVTLSPLFPSAGDTVTFTITLGSLVTASPDFYGTISLKALNTKIQLVDDGTSGDAQAGDRIFTAQIVLPATLSKGRYVLALDILEKAASFDLTQTSAGSFVKSYNGIFATQGIFIDELQELAISASQDTSALKTGAIVPFTATAMFSIGRLNVTKLVTWNSTNQTSGFLDPAGFFYALSPGSTIVYASAGSLSSNSIGVKVQ